MKTRNRLENRGRIASGDEVSPDYQGLLTADHREGNQSSARAGSIGGLRLLARGSTFRDYLVRNRLDWSAVEINSLVLISSNCVRPPVWTHHAKRGMSVCAEEQIDRMRNRRAEHLKDVAIVFFRRLGHTRIRYSGGGGPQPFIQLREAQHVV